MCLLMERELRGERALQNSSRRGNGEGSVFLRSKPDGTPDRWVGSVSLGYGPSGKRRRRTVYGKTEQEVAEKLAALKVESTLLIPQRDRTLTFREYSERWLSQRPMAVSTFNIYQSLLAKFLLPRLGGMSMPGIQRRHILQLYGDLKADGAKTSQLKRAHRLLGHILEEAEECGIVELNVSRWAGFRNLWKTAKRSWKTYFFHRVDNSTVKIGKTKIPIEKRKRAIEVAGNLPELRTMVVLHGDFEKNNGFHEAFAACKIEEEWFSLTPELTEAIQKLNAGHDPRAVISEVPPHFREKSEVVCGRYITIIGASRALNVSPRTVKRLMKRGQLSFEKIHGRVCALLSDVTRMKESGLS